MSDKNIHQKKKCFFASFNNDRGFSLDDKTKDYFDRNIGGQVYSLHKVTTWVIFTVIICIFERSNEKNHFSKTKIHFHKKNYTTIRTYWATKYKSRGESKFWVTCGCFSDAC